MYSIGIVGGSGYTGAELLRILHTHPDAEVTMITSRAEAGTPVAQAFPSLRGRTDLMFTAPDVDALSDCDLVFFATPHNVAMNMVPQLLDKNCRVIDLSADFRLRDAAQWSHWYGEPHACPELLAEAVYGLPEVNAEQVRDARLIACAGCYPTAIQLGFLPLLENNLVDIGSLIASAASGVSGAGKGASVDRLFGEMADSFKAYAASGHRHLPEIEQGLNAMAGEPVSLTFVPHLLPIIRGIHATLISTLRDTSIKLDEIQSVYEQRFAESPFVRVLPAGEHPQTRVVRGTNFCEIALHRPAERDKLVVLVTEDNLVKGASGQAVQLMNLALGLDEAAGLGQLALLP